MDCDHYFNNSKALKEAMCFMMDPALGKKTCYVQFPQRFDGIDLHDRYANRNIVFFDVCPYLIFITVKYFLLCDVCFVLRYGKQLHGDLFFCIFYRST